MRFLGHDHRVRGLFLSSAARILAHYHSLQRMFDRSAGLCDGGQFLFDLHIHADLCVPLSSTLSRTTRLPTYERFRPARQSNVSRLVVHSGVRKSHAKFSAQARQPATRPPPVFVLHPTNVFRPFLHSSVSLRSLSLLVLFRNQSSARTSLRHAHLRVCTVDRVLAGVSTQLHLVRQGRLRSARKAFIFHSDDFFSTPTPHASSQFTRLVNQLRLNSILFKSVSIKLKIQNFLFLNTYERNLTIDFYGMYLMNNQFFIQVWQVLHK